MDAASKRFLWAVNEVYLIHTLPLCVCVTCWFLYTSWSISFTPRLFTGASRWTVFWHGRSFQAIPLGCEWIPFTPSHSPLLFTPRVLIHTSSVHRCFSTSHLPAWTQLLNDSYGPLSGGAPVTAARCSPIFTPRLFTGSPRWAIFRDGCSLQAFPMGRYPEAHPRLLHCAHHALDGGVWSTLRKNWSYGGRVAAMHRANSNAEDEVQYIDR